MKIKKWEIVDHGVWHNQYFPGFGISFSPFTDIWTGAGDSASEAYRDALDQAYADIGEAADALQKRPRGIRARPRVPAGHEDAYFYVSIRATMVDDHGMPLS